MKEEAQQYKANLYCVLNANIITERKQRDAIVSMGMSSCQVHCIAVSGMRHYSAKH